MQRFRRVIIVIGATLGCAHRPTPHPTFAPAAEAVPPVKPPESRESVPTRRDKIVETLFGTEVSDPYRWLEQGQTAEVTQWIAAQNDLTRRFVDATGIREPLRERLAELLKIGNVWRPWVRRKRDGGLRYFYRRREGDQNQPILLVRDGADGADRTLLDPNQLSEDGTIALDWYYPSEDGSLVAYGLSEDGTEQSTLRVRDVDSAADRPDTITRTRFSSVCWEPASDGFYYTRYPDPKTVPEGEQAYHRKLYHHRLGDEPDSDVEVFGSGRAMTDYPGCTLSPDGRWLMVSVHQGWNKTELFLADTRKRPLQFAELTEGKEQTYTVQVENEAFFVLTDDGAPKGRLLYATPRAPELRAWKEIVPEHATDVLDDVAVVSRRVIASYSRAAVSRLERFDDKGKSLGEIPLPGVGSVGGISALSNGSEALVDFETFTEQTSVHRVDVDTGTITQFLKVELDVNAADFSVTRHTARSKDGTEIPFVRVARADLGAGPQPTVLYGYGGFNISLRPGFTPAYLAFLESGGVYVQANLRGGGEGGEAWHRAGQRDKKQNVFDDFIAVAEELIKAGLTSRDKLAIYGHSNGGLLVAAALTQRPDLFRAAVSAVPLTDMLRYPRFLLAKLWVPEYGSPDEPDAFRWLYAYSPYHRVRRGTAYPSTLFTTAESDTRVDPAHARKMTAALQWATSSGRPVLLRTEIEAGHGAGKPMQKRVEEYADLFAFLMHELGIEPRGK